MKTILSSSPLFPSAFLSSLFLLAPLAAQLPADLPEPSKAQQSESQARSLAESIRERYFLPGLSVAVAKEGSLVYSEGLGMADLEAQVPVTPLTRFRIGSLSKLLTIAAVARLQQEGELDLDATVRDYVPYFPEKKFPILVRQLAAHTSGIRHYGPDDGIDVPKYYPSVRDGLKIFEADPLLFEPGTGYQYSSYAYNLLSAVVEGASDRDFLGYMQEEVFEALGMRSTAADNNFLILPNRTRFYHRVDEGITVNAPAVDNSYKWGSGGFLSTPEDLVRLGLAFMEPGFLAEESIEDVFTAQPGAKQRSFDVGLGWRIVGEGDERQYHHGGAIAGGRAFILLVPAKRAVVVLLGNAFVGFGLDEARELLAVFDRS